MGANSVHIHKADRSWKLPLYIQLQKQLQKLRQIRNEIREEDFRRKLKPVATSYHPRCYVKSVFWIEGILIVETAEAMFGVVRVEDIFIIVSNTGKNIYLQRKGNVFLLNGIKFKPEEIFTKEFLR